MSASHPPPHPRPLSPEAGARGGRKAPPRHRVFPRLEPLETRALCAAGYPDATFGANGRAVVAFVGTDGVSRQDVATDVAIDAQNRPVAVGWTQLAGGTLDFAVTRLTASGVLDATFGTGGRARIAFDVGGSREDRATAVHVLPDGKILVAGFAQTSATNFDFAICRLTASGSLDATFGTGGKRLVSFGAGNDRAFTLAVHNNRIYLGGIASPTGDADFAVARLTLDGRLDAGFSGDARTVVPFDLGGGNQELATGMAVLADGRVVLGGHAFFDNAGSSDVVACRLTATGSIDATFGNAGKTRVAFSGAPTRRERADELLLQDDGKLVLVGQTLVNGAFDMGVIRLTANGFLDATFSGDGRATVSFDRGGGNNDVALEGEIDADGDIVVLGWAETATRGRDMAVARLTPTGVLDAAFGAMGRNTVGFDLGGTRNDEGNGMALDADGRIVVVGSAATSARGDDIAVARLRVDGVGLLRSGRRMFGRPAR